MGRMPKMSMQVPTVVVAGFLLLCAGCTGRDEALLKRQSAEMKRVLASVPPNVRRDRNRAALWKAMQGLYASRHNEPISIEGLYPASQFDALIAALQQIRTHGINPERYEVAALTSATAETSRQMFRRKPLEERSVVSLDVKATWAWIRAAADLSAGATDSEGSADKLWRLRRQKIDFDKRLAEALDSGAVDEKLQDFAPAHPEYVRLKDTYGQYVAIADTGGWKSLPASLTLKKGDRSPLVAALAQRLQAGKFGVERFDRPRVWRPARGSRCALPAPSWARARRRGRTAGRGDERARRQPHQATGAEPGTLALAPARHGRPLRLRERP